MQLTLHLNGIPICEEIAPDTLLLDFLRAHGCKSVKRGCETSMIMIGMNVCIHIKI